MYELLSGKRPFEFANLSLSEITRIVGLTSPAPPSARIRSEADRRGLAAQLRGDLDNIVLKAMHRDAEPSLSVSGRRLRADIQNYLDGRPVQARPDTWTYRARKFLRRNVWADGWRGGVGADDRNHHRVLHRASSPKNATSRNANARPPTPSLNS